jgi:hypothetical protein
MPIQIQHFRLQRIRIQIHFQILIQFQIWIQGYDV